ncbi:hypothetical protein PR048_028176 [Dryococelus australis]|uniref:Uncharacterized protein n=1 Tax=Dryococelus australis TaxID=614101 RepID=A0ABQ9GIG3_9NEOP|nr:hypothetical protein PR048_028176 [Dryococelus australis]
MKGQGKRDIPKKTLRPVAYSGTIPTYDSRGTTPPGIEPGSPRWEASMNNGPHLCAAERLARSPPTMANRAESPDYRKWESCRTMPLVGGFSRGSRVPARFHFGAAPYSPQSPSSALKTSLLRAAKISCALITSRQAAWWRVNKRQGCPRGVVFTPRAGRFTPALRLDAREVRPKFSAESPTPYRPATSLNLPVNCRTSGTDWLRREFANLCPMRVIEMSMEQRRNEKEGETGDPEKTRRPTASSATIPTYDNLVIRPGMEPGSPWWEVSVLTTRPPRAPIFLRFDKKSVNKPPPRAEDDSRSVSVHHSSSLLETLAPRLAQWLEVLVGCYPPDAAVPRWFERLARSPPTKANRFQSPAGSPDFRRWESCQTMPLVGGFYRGSPVSPALSLRCCFIFTSITLIGSLDLAVKSRPNLFTHSLLVMSP